TASGAAADRAAEGAADPGDEQHDDEARDCDGHGIRALQLARRRASRRRAPLFRPARRGSLRRGEAHGLTAARWYARPVSKAFTKEDDDIGIAPIEGLRRTNAPFRITTEGAL